jgi:tetratricopeptide (TPR) repeat protein
MGGKSSTLGVGPRDEAVASTAIEDVPNDFPKLGLRLNYLNELIVACGGRAELDGLSTADVGERFIKPWTWDSKTSFCEWLNLQAHPAVGKANVFISHAWKCSFLDVMDAIVTHMRERTSKENKDPIIWFCLFSNNQHELDVLDFEWFHKTFQTAVGEIGHTVMVLSPWDNPLPFTRAWCIWEVYCSATQKCLFEIAMSEPDRLQFINDVTKDTEGAMKKMLATVRAEKSHCFLEEDRNKIFSVIKQTIGFAKINSMVFEQYRSWVLQTTTDTMVQSISTLGLMYQSQGKYDEAGAILEESVLRAAAHLGKCNPRTLKCVDRLANVYMDQGKYLQSMNLVHKCLSKRKRILGEDHVDTVKSMETLARWCCAQKKMNKARRILHICHQKRNDLLGDDHPDTLTSINRLGTVYMKKKHYTLAKQLLEDCLEKRAICLGDDHPDTLASLNNLALLYMRQKDYARAQPLLEKCLAKRKEMLGEEHPDTLTLMNNVASIGMKQGAYEEAALLLQQCFEKDQSFWERTIQIPLPL